MREISRGRLMSPAHETQSMREIRLLRGRLPRKGGGLTGMNLIIHCDRYLTYLSDIDISFVMFHISTKCLLFSEFYSLSLKLHYKESIEVNRLKRAKD